MANATYILTVEDFLKREITVREAMCIGLCLFIEELLGETLSDFYNKMYRSKSMGDRDTKKVLRTMYHTRAHQDYLYVQETSLWDYGKCGQRIFTHTFSISIVTIRKQLENIYRNKGVRFNRKEAEKAIKAIKELCDYVDNAARDT